MRLINGIFMGVAALGAAGCGVALAQSYPVKPIRLHVTCPAACLPDLFGRAIGQSLSESWGQPIVVDNRAGAQHGRVPGARQVPG